MNGLIEGLVRTAPFITCEAGNGYRVVMSFSKLEHAQEIYEALCRAIVAHRLAQSPALPPGEAGDAPR